MNKKEGRTRPDGSEKGLVRFKKRKRNKKTN